MGVILWIGRSVGKYWMLSRSIRELTACNRFPKMMYTAEGRASMERLWQETMTEFEFAGVKQILDSMRARQA
jgi:hypothetical protein